jgi:hypothetical protein
VRPETKKQELVNLNPEMDLEKAKQAIRNALHDLDI